jgi:hypothetical protein
MHSPKVVPGDMETNPLPFKDFTEQEGERSGSCYSHFIAGDKFLWLRLVAIKSGYYGTSAKI